MNMTTKYQNLKSKVGVVEDVDYPWQSLIIFVIIPRVFHEASYKYPQWQHDARGDIHEPSMNFDCIVEWFLYMFLLVEFIEYKD